ncbi:MULTISPECIES: ABC transporter permease [unclassified Alteromonas]|uniref:ABC transporter permease n=1 Tax=unclassified Alteromonas TaxID=2614992 RepID=UPI000E68299B|nr:MULTISPECIES: ABC transporter permease subunit [unclassified Alteromonas]AYA65130.1 ABC transporter permease [Alteromonas sp. RKMC-009]MDO6474976.1 ABC transporter permease [Alteromonas sp. 1_MG-2023]MEC7690293.1 ABC transporter permease subunit [Pseudomonadota bacterium]
MRSLTIARREFGSFFATPVAYVYLVMFLVLSSVFTFFMGDFYARGQADLLPFFNFHPWLYLFLVPAIAMRSWAEERKSGTIELLMTLPVSETQAVAGKFLACWGILGLALLMTTPLWLTVNYLGSPDNGIIVAAYTGSWLMAGAFLAISQCMSALTHNQVIAFVMSVLVCFLFLVSGSEIVVDVFKNWAPNFVVDTVASFSFLTHFEAMSKGVLAANDVVYFLLVIFVWLTANAVITEQNKAG